MKITVFTSNQPRHISLINSLSGVADTVHAVLECNTVFPGRVQDFYKKTPVMQEYFSKVVAAEKKLFHGISFSHPKAKILAIKGGDLNLLSKDQLADALHADAYVVFGASFIKGWLIDFLVSQKALNIHMGLSPYYRGTACNFWALYDDNPQGVGATIHYLSKGLDSGPMLYHAVPKMNVENPFEFTMQAVVAAHESLVDRISSRKIFELEPQKQDKSREIRYSKNADFTDAEARGFLDRQMTMKDIRALIERNKKLDLLNPYFQK